MFLKYAEHANCFQLLIISRRSKNMAVKLCNNFFHKPRQFMHGNALEFVLLTLVLFCMFIVSEPRAVVIDLCQLLELLWELAHLPMLKTSLVELALEEHLAVLSDPFAVKEQVKKQYVIKCVEDIREVLVFVVVMCFVPLSVLYERHLACETRASYI